MTAEACPDRRPVEREYARVVERHRDELHAHSRRILRSSQDAEDALQEALLRAWRALPSFEGRSSLRSWLFRIVTNASLDVIKRRPELVVPTDPEHPAVSPEAGPQDRLERREALERALLTACRLFPERQREVLIMREALGFSAQETADRLETTVAAVNSALQRARARIDRRLDEQSTHETASSLEDPRGRESESA
jgi:RNA polymerase sigma-70 factor, ECF subfamily